MKALVVFFFALLMLSNVAKAQKRGEHDVTTPYADVKEQNGEVTQVKLAPQNVGRVYGTTGAVYTSQTLENLPTRNVNKISSMTLDVQYNYGNDPIIRGAPGGTAYFVDGIRIRSGSLCLPGFSN